MRNRQRAVSIIGVVIILITTGTMYARDKSKSSRGKKETITVMLQKHTASDALVKMIDEFTKETQIKVNIDVLPQEQITPKTQLLLSFGDNNVDVIMYDHMFTTQFAGADWIRDLTPFIKKTQYTVDDFMGGYISALSYKNKIYALPVYGESTMLMYNKELFAKAGISKVPGTKAEFDADLEKLKAAGIPAIVLRGDKQPGGNVYIWSGFFLAQGGNWFDKSGRLSLNTPEAVNAAKYYSELLNTYSIPGGATLSWDQVQLAVQQGKAAMAIDATNFSSRIEQKDSSSVCGKMGYAAIPEGVAQQSIACWGLAIPKASKHAEAAWKFIEWALSAKMQLYTTTGGNRCDVTRKSVMNDPGFKQIYGYDNGNWVQTAIASIDGASADYRPRIEDWAKLGDSVAGAVSSVTSGQDTAEKAFARVQKECGTITYPTYKK
jgi:ABC-type glycerol-3-phosphate transport system substrate-binding protein